MDSIPQATFTWTRESANAAIQSGEPISADLRAWLEKDRAQANMSPQLRNLMEKARNLETIIKNGDDHAASIANAAMTRRIGQIIRESRRFNQSQGKAPAEKNSFLSSLVNKVTEAGLEYSVHKRKSAINILRSPSQFLAAIKEMKRQKDGEGRSEDRQNEIELQLLEEFAAEPKPEKTTTKKKGKQKRKTGSRSGAKKTLKHRVTSPPEDCAEAGVDISPLQQLVNSILVNFGPKEGSHHLHRRVRRWDAHKLMEKDIIEWEGYADLERKERIRQIINHMGIGLHKLLDSPKLRNDFVFESKRGPMMWCTIKPHRGAPITGKIHFGVRELENGRKLVYHRMFTEAGPAEISTFINTNAPQAFEDGPLLEEVQIGSIEAIALANGNLQFRQKGHSYIKAFTLHRLV